MATAKILQLTSPSKRMPFGGQPLTASCEEWGLCLTALKEEKVNHAAKKGGAQARFTEEMEQMGDGK